MRAVVVYESVFGNTHVLADHIATGLAATHEVSVVPVHEATPELLDGVGLLIVGGPTHMHGMTTEKSRAMAVAPISSSARAWAATELSKRRRRIKV